MEHVDDGDTNCNLFTWNDPRRLEKGARGDESWRTSRNYPNYSIVKISQITEKNPGELKRLTVTQNLAKYHQLVR